MSVITIGEPTVEPVLLADVYLHLRLTPGQDGTHPDDALLTGQITAARTWAEQYTRRAFIRQKLRLVLSDFPCFRARFGGGSFGGDDDDFVARNGYVEMKRPPLLEVDAVSYVNDANAPVTVDEASYYVPQGDLVPRLQFVDAFATPATYLRDDAVRIDYFAGYGDDGDAVPASIKQAILIGVQLLYDQLATDQRAALERARESLLSSYRVHTL